MNNTQNSAQDGLHKSKLTDGKEENYFYSDRYADPMFYLLAAVKPWNTPLWFLRAFFSHTSFIIL